MAVQAYFRNVYLFNFLIFFIAYFKIGLQDNVINKLGFGNKKTAVSFW